jgi:hypothetical protein
MRRIATFFVFLFLCLLMQSSTRAQDIVVPAGTLLRCTMDEPNFSSATADIGDPTLCHLSSLRQFGAEVFPRGSYLGGHLEADKEPGHFVGKGYMRVVFDRIGFPTSDIPVPGKVIAARGYKVDKQGDILGKGHAKRDVVEWLIPPLWPWKILTLPARGPRPALKGEEQITVRLMDDIVVPRSVVGGFGARPTSYERPAATFRRQSFGPAPTFITPSSAEQQDTHNGTANATLNNIPAAQNISQTAPAPDKAAIGNVADASMVSANVLSGNASAVSAPTSNAVSGNALNANAITGSIKLASAVRTSSVPQRSTVHISAIALKTDKVYAVTSYHVEGSNLNYVLTNGIAGSVSISEVDWRKTSRLNTEPLAAVISAAKVEPHVD